MIVKKATQPLNLDKKQCRRTQRFVGFIEYDGSKYHGWQKLKSGFPTIQQKLEFALSCVANHPVSVVCSGRTDAGVHALRQVVHFESNAARSCRNWLLGANIHLPSDIVVTEVLPVSSSFHARFSALRRSYRYIICNRNVRSALNARRVAWTHRPLDAVAMNKAAQLLLGEHDFTSYRATQCQAHSPIRHIYHCSVKRVGTSVVLNIQANGFLHHMVRNIAGVLQKIGVGDEEIDWSFKVLEAKDRRCASITASPDGLYLVSAIYDQSVIEHPALNLANNNSIWDTSKTQLTSLFEEVCSE